MFRGDLLIDGYNLLHAAGLSRRSYGPGEFDRTRRRMLKLLAGQLFERERRRTTVVFDAPAQSLGSVSLGSEPPSVIDGIRVIFAGGDGDADAAIERLIRQNTAPRRLHVISSDHRLQRAARRRRARFFDSDVFLATIVRRPTPQERTHSAEPAEKREGLTAPGEVDAWLEAFSDLPSVENVTPTKQDPTASPQSRGQNLPEANTAARAKAADNATDVEAGEMTAPGDVAFWEARIAELWQQTDVEDRSS